MTEQQKEEIIRNLFNHSLKTLESKSNDYSNEDALVAFKKIANMIGVSKEKVCLMFIATKVQRITNLLEKDKINNESLDDSVLDLVSYSALLKCLLNDNEK